MNTDQLIASVTTPVLTRERVAEYAEASGDLNPVHLDSAVAKSAGHSDVIVHGMLVMALAANALSDIPGIARLDLFSVRFVAVTPVDSTLTIDITTGPERQPDTHAGNELGLVVRRDDGTTVMTGRARVHNRVAEAVRPDALREGAQW